MLQKFKIFIEENKLFRQGDRILLAVSGGIDSMVMTHLFMQLENETGIAHCNFSLRARESDMDEELVSKFAAANNMAFHSKRFETKARAKEEGVSVQMAARELRYDWFEKIRMEFSYDYIAVAHNLNDNIETLLINLIRGTGIAGLTGMKPLSGRIIRPLLFATRQEITSYCKLHEINYREDMSNAETRYTRNKIRHLVIPLLREINPSIESTLNETAERMTGINEIVSGYIFQLRENISRTRNELIIFNAGSLSSYLDNKAVLFELFKPFGISNIPLNDLVHVIKGRTGASLFTGTNRITKNRDEIIVSSSGPTGILSRTIENLGELETVPEIASFRLEKISPDFKIPAGQLSACVDYDKLKFPLVIRKWKEGDHFYPFGMSHKKKLSDYFIDSKYSIPDKNRVRIMESGGKIVWIIGDRIDNRFRITGTSSNALVMKALDEAGR
jgi:tRNA(Ile)-lysidine synthase